jgi:hypothetical protein
MVLGGLGTDTRARSRGLVAVTGVQVHHGGRLKQCLALYSRHVGGDAWRRCVGERNCELMLFLVPSGADDGGTVADEGIEKRSALTSMRNVSKPRSTATRESLTPPSRSGLVSTGSGSLCHLPVF